MSNGGWAGDGRENLARYPTGPDTILWGTPIRLDGYQRQIVALLPFGLGVQFSPSPTTIAALAQLVEHLNCNQRVTGSSPVGGTIDVPC